MKNRTAIVALALPLALAGCGGSESANPLSGTTLPDTRFSNSGKANTPAVPVPVFLTVDPAKTSSSAIVSLRRASFSRVGDQDVLSELSGLSFRPRSLVVMDQDQVKGRKFLYLGMLPRNTGYSKLNLSLAPTFTATPLGGASKQGTWENAQLSLSLDATKALADALVLELSVNEETKKLGLALGKADGVLEEANQQPTLVQVRLTGAELAAKEWTLRSSTATLGMFKLPEAAWSGSKPKAGPALLGGVWSPKAKAFQPAFGCSPSSHFVSSPDGVVASDPSQVGKTAEPPSTAWQWRERPRAAK